MNKPIIKNPDIDKTRRALDDIRLDIEKWERIYHQLSKVDGVEIILYTTHEKIVELEHLQFILKSHLNKMGGR